MVFVKPYSSWAYAILNIGVYMASPIMRAYIAWLPFDDVHGSMVVHTDY